MSAAGIRASNGSGSRAGSACSRRLSTEEIAVLGGVHAGQNVLGINIAEVQRRIAASEWVESVSVTRILPEPVHLTAAELSYPANREAPIAADLRFRTTGGVPVEAVFDWRQLGPQTWDIEVETASGRLSLTGGGSRLAIDGRERLADADREYQGLYRRFVALINAGQSDVDLAPMILVADAFLLGQRREVEPFED